MSHSGSGVLDERNTSPALAGVGTRSTAGTAGVAAVWVFVKVVPSITSPVSAAPVVDGLAVTWLIRENSSTGPAPTTSDCPTEPSALGVSVSPTNVAEPPPPPPVPSMPGTPCGPCGPATPCGPAAPCAPSAPATPAIPAAPVSPFAPPTLVRAIKLLSPSTDTLNVD